MRRMIGILGNRQQILAVVFILMIFFLPFSAFAEAGPPIEIPSVSAVEAIALAQKALLSIKEPTDPSYKIRHKDFILTDLKYTDYWEDKFQKDWAWYVTFRHPIANDCSVTYKITNDRKVIEERVTE